MIIVSIIFEWLLVLSIFAICTWLWKYLTLWKALSIIPGPQSFPFIGTVWQVTKIPYKDRFAWYNKLCERFETGLFLIWIGMEPVVVVNEPKYVEMILTSSTLLTKGTDYELLRPMLGNGLITSSGSVWAKHRKLIAPAFHFKVLEEITVTIQDEVKIFVDCIETKLRKNVNAPLNILEFAANLTFDIICETAMGVKINAQKKSDNEHAEALHKIIQLTSERAFQFWLKWDFIYFRTSKGKENWEAQQTIHSFTEKVILQKQINRMGMPSRGAYNAEKDEFRMKNRRTFLDLLLDNSRVAENSLTLRELREEIDTFMTAGQDTTSMAISWTLFALGNEPDIQDKVHDELREVFADEKEIITTKKLRQLKYLDRVIKESMRLYCIIPTISRCLDRDMIIDGYLIPKGTNLEINIYQLHRNPKVWEDPEKFNPDRFLVDSIRTRSRYAYVPFSAGPRNCIGQKLASLEMKMALAAVLRKWRVRSVLKPPEINLSSNLVLRPHDEKIELYFTPME